MKNIQIILLFLVLVIVSCDKPTFPKPEHLVKERQMVKILIDVHIAEATFNNVRSDTLFKGLTSSDFYYSVLRKYEIPDSVFEQSFVYYASEPKKLEKIYQKVMNELNIMEQEISGRKQDLLEFEEEQQ